MFSNIIASHLCSFTFFSLFFIALYSVFRYFPLCVLLSNIFSINALREKVFFDFRLFFEL